MKITFCGAAQRVTGSNFLVETGGTKFLVDCGLFQGDEHDDQLNWDEFAYDPQKIDFVIITHSHIDHVGRLPLLYQKGFRGKVYSTTPTQAFCRIFLEDTVHILKDLSERLKIPKLYDMNDVGNIMSLFEPLDYYQEIKPTPKITIKLYDAGHILGSAIIEVQVEGKTIIFSGDLGNPPVPMLRDTDFISRADYVVMESTYGDQEHEPFEKRQSQLAQTIKDAITKKGVLLIPAFAMERTQEILYELDDLVEHNRIPHIPIFIDSPLAIKATQIYKTFPQYFDKEAQELIKSGNDFFQFRGLKFTRTSEESKLIDQTSGSKIIIAGSGMSTGGRILFHEKRFLPEPSTIILFVGFQVNGSLGRALKNHKRIVYIHGDRVRVQAETRSIESYSAHADQPRLIYWLSKIKDVKQVFLVHGEKEVMNILSQQINEKQRLNVLMPEFKQSVKI